MSDVGNLLIMATASLLALYLMLHLANRPRQALSIWLGVLAFIPSWWTVEAGPLQIPPAAAAAIVVMPAALRGADGDRIRGGDWLLIVSVAVLTGATALSTAPPYLVAAIGIQGVSAYVVGRRLVLKASAEWSIGAIAWVTVACAIWALLEMLFRVHLFESIAFGAPDLMFWADIQERGALPRVEAAWGHSIALGGWFALGLPFVFSAKWGAWRWWALALTLAGVLATLSRGPIVGCVVALGLCVFFLKSVPSATRLAVATCAAFASFAVIPVALSFFGAVGAELNATQEYRINLLTHVSEDLRLLGRADTAYTGSDGKLVYRGFGSLDNAVLAVAVDAGYLVAGLLAFGLLVALARVVLSPRTTPADIALASQIPVLLTVAMITQYQAAVFFIAGVAVALCALQSNESCSQGGDDERAALGSTGDTPVLPIARFRSASSAHHGPESGGDTHGVR